MGDDYKDSLYSKKPEIPSNRDVPDSSGETKLILGVFFLTVVIVIALVFLTR